MSAAMVDHTQLILDGTTIAWHLDRVRAWQRGERIAPITIDMALTRACNYGCEFCYAAMLQENDRKVISRRVIFDFLEDCRVLHRPARAQKGRPIGGDPLAFGTMGRAAAPECDP